MITKNTITKSDSTKQIYFDTSIQILLTKNVDPKRIQLKILIDYNHQNILKINIEVYGKKIDQRQNLRKCYIFLLQSILSI